MIYGVKIIKTQSVGEDNKRFYEELILKVTAESFDEAYEKAENYMKETEEAVGDYINISNEQVRTLSTEAVDCFLALEPENDIQEIYSSFSTNKTCLSDDEYYDIVSSSCTENELKRLRQY